MIAPGLMQPGRNVIICVSSVTIYIGIPTCANTVDGRFVGKSSKPNYRLTLTRKFELRCKQCLIAYCFLTRAGGGKY